MNRVLIVKLGALGDFVLALAAMKRIREAHPEAEITLLTTPPYAALGAASPYIDRVRDDGRPSSKRAQAAMLLQLRRARFDRVYDLQTSTRSSVYFFALHPDPPEWSGVAPGCSHPHRNPDRDRMHTLERQADQLKDAGIWPDALTTPGTAPPPDLTWLTAAPPVELPEAYALLIPGGSAHRPEKRWPIDRHAALANGLAARGLTPVVLGGPAERDLAPAIAAAEPSAVDLTGRTDVAQLATLARHARLAVGGDTGPTHVAAAAGAPTLALFSAASDPALCAPRGPRAQSLRRPDLADLSVEEVLAATEGLARSA